MLRDRSQLEMTTQYMIPIIWHYGKGKTTEIVKRLKTDRGLDKTGVTNRWNKGDVLGQWCWIHGTPHLLKPIELYSIKIKPLHMQHLKNHLVCQGFPVGNKYTNQRDNNTKYLYDYGLSHS